MPEPIPHGWTTERLRARTGRSWEDWRAMLSGSDAQAAQQALFRAIQGYERPGMSYDLRSALEDRLRDDWSAWNLYNQRWAFPANPPTQTANFADWLSSMVSGGGAATRPTIMRELGQWATGERLTDPAERERARLARQAMESSRDPYSAANILAEALGYAPVVRQYMMREAPSTRGEYGQQERPGTDYYSWYLRRLRGG